MIFKIFALGCLSTIILSCNNSNEETSTNNAEIVTTGTSAEIKNEKSEAGRNRIITELEGEWKELTYPFRVAHFKDSTVKFIEEGVLEEPKFKEYQILNECPYEVNNIKNATPNDIFLVMVKDRTCEILKLSNDTLTLNGFSVNTNGDYNIFYKKVK
jgi:hypothetical protein